MITIDETTRRIELEVPAAEIAARLEGVEGARPAGDPRRAREVRASRLVGVAGGGDGIEYGQVRS